MQRNNLRLYRVARSVLGDDRDVEDVLQEAYVRAFAGLADFRGEATLSTWLTRIVLNEALGRVRRQRPTVSVEIVESATAADEGAVIPFPLSAQAADAEREAARREIRSVVERLIDQLPEQFRVVFVMRAVEEFTASRRRRESFSCARKRSGRACTEHGRACDGHLRPSSRLR